MSRRRHMGTAGLLVALVLAVSACGGDDEAEAEGVASLTDEPSPETPEGRQSMAEAVLDFTRCLRDQGLDVPDIQLDAEGAPIIRPEDVAGIDVDSPEVQSAFDACMPILTDAGAFSFASDPELQALLQDSLQDFAECMRREGIVDFPDPETSGSGLPFPVSAFGEFADEAFQDALDTCRDEIGFVGLDE